MRLRATMMGVMGVMLRSQVNFEGLDGGVLV